MATKYISFKISVEVLSVNLGSNITRTELISNSINNKKEL